MWGRSSCRSSCCPTKKLSYRTPPVVCSCSARDNGIRSRCKGRLLGLFVAMEKLEACLEEVTAVIVTSFAISLPTRIKISFKKRKLSREHSWKPTLTTLTSLFLGQPACSQSLLSADLRRKSCRKRWSVLCRIRNVGKESGCSILQKKGAQASPSTPGRPDY